MGNGRGLRMFWRKQHILETEEMVAWNDSYGKFDHCWDAIVAKGFHRCEMTLSGGERIVVYDMHLDASTDYDEAGGYDRGDIEARRSQWIQLRDEVLAHLDSRPVILLGDMNSLYPATHSGPLHRPHQCHWVSSCLRHLGGVRTCGRYPRSVPVTNVAYANGEVLDKILYINPAHGTQLRLESYLLETDYTYDDGTPMGDHYPVSPPSASGMSRLRASAP